MRKNKRIRKKLYEKILLLCMVLLGIIAVMPRDRVSAATTNTCAVVFISEDGTSIPTRNVSQGSYLTSLPTPTREGYIFSGWYLDEKHTMKISTSYFVPVQSQDSVLVLYAGWTKIRVNLIVATYADQTAVVDSDIDRSKITVTAIYSNGTKGTVTNFTISNLRVTSLGMNVFNVTYENCVTSFYVVGVVQQYYSVMFIPNGGTNVDKIPKIKSGDTIILPQDPTRSGYTFVGWYQDSSFTIPFTSKTKVTYNMLAYAKWEKDVIEDETVVYTLNATHLRLNLYEEDNVFIESYNGDLENYVTYKSSNPDVVSVNKVGRIEGLKYGRATIYVIAPDGTRLKCKVYVKTKHPAESIRTNVRGKRLKVGSTFYIKTTISPGNVTIKKVKYYSTKKSVAKVSSSGRVTAKKKGTCYIIVKTLDGTNLRKKIKIIVR